MPNSSRFFANTDCAYFPCHKTGDADTFNCLFCYCPLYFAPSCIGNPKWTEQGVKDCSGCREPHKPENYDAIVSALSRAIREQAKERQARALSCQKEQLS